MSGIVIPTVMDVSGLQPIPPSDLDAQLIALVAASNPGYTVLPGGLIEDISSTDVGALTLIDQARVELVNSITPFGANAFLLNQLGAIYGVSLGIGSNTSALVVFTGPPGFLIAAGFTVSDGTNQYVVQDGGVIAASGMTAPLFALATSAGTFSVPPGTVTHLATSVPPPINAPGGPTLTVTNPTAGTPGTGVQAEPDYRAQVLQAGRAVSMGMASYLRTLLGNVPGVQPRLISILQRTGGWEIIVGGGDPYQVAAAILEALFDISTLVGSAMTVSNITAANPGVVTTVLNHGYVTGQSGVIIEGVVGMTQVNGVDQTVTVIDEKTFSIEDTSTFTPYASGGIVTPNARNEAVSINDFPDTYLVLFVNPPQQNVSITVTWNTTSPNFVSPVAVAQLGTAALVSYINSIQVGQPINLFELQNIFQDSIATVVPPQQLTRMVFAVNINGQGVAPIVGTGIISGDPESFFLTSAAAITVTQG